jgi:hypothetical protein
MTTFEPPPAQPVVAAAAALPTQENIDLDRMLKRAQIDAAIAAANASRAQQEY